MLSARCLPFLSPHIQPNLATKTLNIFDFFKFSCFFFKYFLEFLFSLLTTSNLIISSHRWSSRSLGYQSSIKSSLSLDSNTSFLYFRSYLDTSSSSNSLLSCLLLGPAIDLYLERIRSTYKDSTNDNGVSFPIEYDNLHDFTLFINFLDNSLVSGNINHLAICLSKYFLLLLVALVNFINLFAKNNIYYISTNCWNMTDYLHHVLALSNFDVKLVGCQHGCKYFESTDPFTEVEINSPCFYKYIKFGLSEFEVHPDDVLKLVPQTEYYDVVYIMKYFPSVDSLPDFSSLFTVLARVSSVYSLQIRVHPKSSYLLPKLKNIFQAFPSFSNVSFFIAANKFVGLPSCNIVICDSPYSTLAWHSTCRGIESVFVEYDTCSNEFSHLYTRKFQLRPYDDDGLYEYIKALN